MTDKPKKKWIKPDDLSPDEVAEEGPDGGSFIRNNKEMNKPFEQKIKEAKESDKKYGLGAKEMISKRYKKD